MELSNFHLSFSRGEQVKSLLEFNMPEDAEYHYACLKGPAYQKTIMQLAAELDSTIREANGTAEAEYLSQVLTRLMDLAVENDVRVFRK